MNIVHAYVGLLRKLKVDFIDNTPGNEMYRIGGGFNKNRGFVRVDTGSLGIRFTQRKSRP